MERSTTLLPRFHGEINDYPFEPGKMLMKSCRYPGELAWQLSAPKRVVRKTEPFKRFQRFLVGETEVVS